jgi:hypothetical protein
MKVKLEVILEVSKPISIGLLEPALEVACIGAKKGVEETLRYVNRFNPHSDSIWIQVGKIKIIKAGQYKTKFGRIGPKGFKLPK